MLRAAAQSEAWLARLFLERSRSAERREFQARTELALGDWPLPWEAAAEFLAAERSALLESGFLGLAHWLHLESAPAPQECLAER